MRKLIGESWKTTLIGYLYFIAEFVYQMYLREGTTNWKNIVFAACVALIGRVAADSKQVKKVKRDLHDTKAKNDLM